MNEDQARNRFVIISLVRLAGAAISVFGLTILSGRVALPAEAGIVLTLVGLADFMIAPMVLARRWKTPRP